MRSLYADEIYKIKVKCCADAHSELLSEVIDMSKLLSKIMMDRNANNNHLAFIMN